MESFIYSLLSITAPIILITVALFAWLRSDLDKYRNEHQAAFQVIESEVGSLQKSVLETKSDIKTLQRNTKQWRDESLAWQQDMSAWRTDVDLWRQDVDIWRTDVNAWRTDVNAWRKDVNAWQGRTSAQLVRIETLLTHPDNYKALIRRGSEYPPAISDPVE